MTQPSVPSGSTLGRLVFHAAESFGERPAQRFKRDGAWQDISHAGLATITDELARGLIALGVQPGDRVAVLGDTRPEWVHAAYAVAAAGGIVVPIYASSSPQDCTWVLQDSGSVAVVCENAAQLAKIASIRDGLPDLRYLLSMEEGAGDGVTSLAALAGRGREQDPAERERRTAATQTSDPAIIIYTSGTTGPPKGCVLTHGNLTACAQQAIDLGLVTSDDVAYLFLPLAHVFAQTTNVVGTVLGAVTAYVSGGTASIVPDLAEVRPTYFPSVPRIFEKVYALFAQAPRTPALLEQVRGILGGRIRVAISGAAPIAPEILEFFTEAGVPIYEGYGLSESTSYGTLNLPGATRVGSVGRPMPFCGVELGEDDEILLSGPHIFAGYWNNPRATAEALTGDGRLLTGDIGRVDDDGYVWITGRKKEIIVTAGGKNITPSQIENELRQVPLISHAVLHGDRRPYPVALITLDEESLRAWAAERGIEGTGAELAEHPQVRAAVQEAVDEINSRHATGAQVKRFALLPQDFSPESGELTPTLKMKRAVITRKYTDVLDGLYGSAAPGTGQG